MGVRRQSIFQDIAQVMQKSHCCQSLNML